MLHLLAFLLSLLALATALPAAEPAAAALAAPAPEADTTLVARGTDGKATYYFQMGAYGSCGAINGDYANIVALSPVHYQGQNPCGRKIKVYARSGPGQGRSVVLTVADKCMGCHANHLDLAYGPFGYLTNYDYGLGVFQIAWAWA